MAKRNTPVGRILKVTHYVASGGRHYTGKIYAVVTRNSHYTAAKVIWPLNHQLEELSLVCPLDKWRLLPDDVVPDYVWAALAQRRLTE